MIETLDEYKARTAVGEEVYYSPRLKLFFQIRRTTKRNCIVSGLVHYYADAQTSLVWYRVDKQHVQNTCIRIEDCRQHGDIVHWDGIGWRTVVRTDHPQDKFFKELRTDNRRRIMQNMERPIIGV